MSCQSQSVESSSIQSKQLISIVMGGEGLFDGQAHEEGGGRDDSRDRDEERKARNRAALKKFRDKEKKEKEEKARRMEELRRENEEIEQRTAVHQQVRWEVRKVVVAVHQQVGRKCASAGEVRWGEEMRKVEGGDKVLADFEAISTVMNFNLFRNR